MLPSGTVHRMAVSSNIYTFASSWKLHRDILGLPNVIFELFRKKEKNYKSNSARAKGNAGTEWRQAADSRRRPKVGCWTGRGEKSINRWPFGTLLLIITIDSEFSTKRSFESLSRIKNIYQLLTPNRIIPNHLHLSFYITLHTEPIMPFHRPQRTIKPFIHFENTSRPGQRFTRSTRSPRRGVIVSEIQPPSNTQGSEGTLRDDVVDVHRTSESIPDLLLDLRAQQEATATVLRQEETRHLQKTNCRQLGGHSAHKGGKHSPRRRHQGNTPPDSLPRGVLAGLASFGIIRNKRQSL